MNTFLALLLLCAFLPQGISLKCYECSGLPYNCLEKEQNCYINQTTCMSQSHSLVVGTNITEWTNKGCSQGLVCNETSYTDFGKNKKYISTQCCNFDYCNTGTYYARVPVAALFCHNCSGSNVSCAFQNLTSIQCAGVQDRCMTITTAAVNGSRRDTVLKGCGTGNLCNRVLEYNAGGARLYTTTSCCGKTNCNNDNNTVNVDDRLNGLSCFACNETGKGQCLEANITKVQCTGSMTYCMDIKGFPRGNTLMRGCCSKDVCLGLSASLVVQASQKIFCCSGNLCNNGDIASYFTSSSSKTQSGLYLLWITLMILANWLSPLL